MKIWITGCSGFLGTRLTDHFSAAGENVIGLSRRSCPNATRSLAIDLSSADSRSTLESLLSENGTPDVVIHAAAKQPGSGDLSAFLNSNVRSASNLVAALDKNPPLQIIYTSTLSVYGRPASLPVDETKPAGGSLPYGATKRWAEQLFENLKERSRATVLRLPSLYGVGQLDSFVDGLAGTALRNEPIELFSRGELIRDALHVSDVVKAIDKCLNQETNPGFSLLNLGIGRQIRTIEYTRELIDALNSDSDIILVDRQGSHFDFYADISQARRQLGFEPMTLTESMKVYANELRASS